MPSTELPWLFLGRRIAPYLLAASLVSFVIAVVELVDEDDYGTAFDSLSLPGVLVGVTALLAAASLWVGWWGRWRTAVRLGLLLSTGVFAARSAFFFAESGPTAVMGWTSLAWVIASGGSYLLETLNRA